LIANGLYASHKSVRHPPRNPVFYLKRLFYVAFHRFRSLYEDAQRQSASRGNNLNKLVMSIEISLHNIEYQANALSGRFEIDARPGRGIFASIEIPLERVLEEK